MPQKKEHRRQISVGFSEPQHEWLALQASRRAIGVAEYLRRLVDGIMLGDNTMSRGVDWQPATVPDVPEPKNPRVQLVPAGTISGRPIGIVAEDVGNFRMGDVVMTTNLSEPPTPRRPLSEEERQSIQRRLSERR